VASICIFLPLGLLKKNIKIKKFTPFKNILICLFMFRFITLIFIGANPVEKPFTVTGQLVRILYFIVVGII
jgi:hypothetical protein